MINIIIALIAVNVVGLLLLSLSNYLENREIEKMKREIDRLYSE
jgi:hypothetical protein